MAHALYECDEVSMEIRPVDSQRDIIWIGIRVTPNVQLVSKLSTILEAWARNTDSKFIFWANHLKDSAELKIPDIPTMIHIIGRLMDHKDLLETRLLGTCVETRNMNDACSFARDQFLALYKPIKPFTIVEGEEKALAFLKTI